MGALTITVKTLQQKQFKLDVDSSDTILSVKEKIEQSQGHAVAQQKLIFSGKILADAKKVEEYNISEKDFLVVMVSKPKVTAASSSKPKEVSPKPATETPAAATPKKEEEENTTSTPVAAAPEQPVATATTTTDTTPETTTATNTNTETTPTDNNSQLVTGAQLDSVIQNMMEMGFEREQCVRALRASYNNPDRAVEYLFSGIPQNILDEMNAAQQQQQQQQQVASTEQAQPQAAPAGTTLGNVPAANSPNAPMNLFAAAQQQQQQQQQQQNAGNAGGVDFSTLRNTPHFQQIRQLVQTNPALLQPLLQQLGQSNPELLRSINADPNGFLQALLEGAEDEEGQAPPPSNMIQVTQEEKDAIDRLVALGFDRGIAIEAYFACEKNEELAANYLFDHGNEMDFE